jgi:hypothetical protein
MWTAISIILGSLELYLFLVFYRKSINNSPIDYEDGH